MKNQREINHIFRMAVMHPAPSPAPNSVALGKWRILEGGPLDWCWEPPPGSFAEDALKRTDWTIAGVIEILSQDPSLPTGITYSGDRLSATQSRQQLKCLLYNMLVEKIHQGKRKNESYLIKTPIGGVGMTAKKWEYLVTVRDDGTDTQSSIHAQYEIFRRPYDVDIRALLLGWHPGAGICVQIQSKENPSVFLQPIPMPDYPDGAIYWKECKVIGKDNAKPIKRWAAENVKIGINEKGEWCRAVLVGHPKRWCGVKADNPYFDKKTIMVGSEINAFLKLQASQSHHKAKIYENITELNLPPNHPQPNEKPQEYDFGDKVRHQPEISLNDKRSVPTWTSTSSDGRELAIKRLNTYLDQAISLFQLHQNIRWDQDAAPTYPPNQTHLMEHLFPSVWTSGTKKGELYFALIKISDAHGWAGLTFPHEWGKGVPMRKENVDRITSVDFFPVTNPPQSTISRKDFALSGKLLYWEGEDFQAWSISHPDAEKLVVNDKTGWWGREVMSGDSGRFDMADPQIIDFITQHLKISDFLDVDWGYDLKECIYHPPSKEWEALSGDGSVITVICGSDNNWTGSILSVDGKTTRQLNRHEIDFFRLCHGIKYDQGVHNRE